MLGNDLAKVKLAFTFLFAYPGAPAVYYGDEIGLKGGKDPECRGAFPWNPEIWQKDLRDWVKGLISLRKRSPALRRGDYQRVLVEDSRRCYAFARQLGDDRILAAFNASPNPRALRLPVEKIGWPDGRIVHNLLTGEEVLVSGQTLSVSLPPWGSALIG